MSAEFHDKITAAFYQAKRAGNITPELQATFDKLHAENWIKNALARPGATLTADDLSAAATTAKEKAALKAVIGDYEL